jgi:site-specific recombinase XerD
MPDPERKTIDDPCALVDWARIQGKPNIGKIASSVDRKKILSVLERMNPYLSEDNYRNTCNAYCSDVAHFLGWCVFNGFTLSEISIEHVTQYVKERPGVKVGQLSRRSMNRRLAAIQLLYEALIENYSWAYGKNPVRKRHFFPSTGSPRPRPLPMPAALAFIGGVENIIDRAVFSFLLFTGCREAEISDIRIEDTASMRDSGTKILEVHIRKGKGGHQRTVYLGGLGLEVLGEYLTARCRNQMEVPRSGDYLLLNHAGLPWTPRRIRKRFMFWRRKLAFTIDTTGWTVHRFRHTILTEMADRDMSIFAMQKISGHRDLNTLLHYVELRDSKTRASYHLAIGKLYE